MFKKSLALLVASLGLSLSESSSAELSYSRPLEHLGGITSFEKGGKGQLRAPKGKSSGAASLKRQAKKRSNIRKRSAK